MITESLTLTKTGWTEIPTIGTYLAVQVPSDGLVVIHMTDGSTPDDEVTVGLTIGRNQSGLPSLIGMGGLPAGSKAFARSGRDTSEELIYVTY